MLQSGTPLAPPGSYAAVHFGAFLKMLRHRHGVKQLQILAHLPGWTQTTYSRVETGEVAPAFDQLVPIYTAMCLVGVELTSLDRQHYLTLARMRIEAKKTYREHKTDQEWDELRLKLSRVDQDSHKHETSAQRPGRVPSRSRLVETRHLVGREDWIASVIASLQETLPEKLVVLQGPVGIGKSSELHRIALYFLSV
ncbi:MAG TPA: helix-turn-helix transcriptional regulator, partial [Ktedonobacteraceae bacterium]